MRLIFCPGAVRITQEHKAFNTFKTKGSRCITSCSVIHPDIVNAIQPRLPRRKL